MASTDIETSISIDLSAYDRSMNRAIKQADTLDSALDAISNTRITPLVEIDTGNLDAVQRQMESAMNGSFSPKIDVETSELDQAIKLLAELDSNNPSVKVNVDDTEVKTADGKINDLNRTEDVKVDVTGDPEHDPDIAGLREELQKIKEMAVIELALNIAEKLPTPAEIPILGTIIEADTAARSLQATLGAGFQPQQAQEAQGIYTDNFGGTRLEAAQAYALTVQQIGDATGLAATSGESLKAITEGIFTVADVSGEDYKAVLAAVDKLYSTGQVDTYAQGLDLITVGFQNGLGAGDDLLDTIREYSPQFDQLGITADEAFNMLKSGMDAGAYNTDFIADLIKEMNIRAQAAMSGSGVEFDALQAMGLLDEAKAYAAGEMTGKQYATALATAAKTGLESGSITAQTIFDALGTKAEDLTIPVTLDILGTEGGGIFGDVTGSAQAASDALYGGIESSIETAKRLIETEVATSINEAFDIQGKVDAFNDGIKQFSALIASGEDIPSAIEKAFNLDGFAATFARFESAIGNLVIEVGNLIASVLEATGNTAGAEGARAGVAGLAQQQLAFDLKLQDDGAGIVSTVQTAIRRGVDEAGLADALAAAGGELIAEGDVLKAQQFVDAIQSVSNVTLPAEVTDYLSGKGIDPTNLVAVRTELERITNDTTNVLGVELFKNPFQDVDPQELLAQLDTATIAQSAAQPIVDEFNNTLSTGFEEMFANGQFLKGAMTAFGLGETDTATIFGSEILNQFKDLPNQIMTGLADAGGKIPILQTLETDLDNANTKVGETMPVIGAAIQTSGTQPFEAFTTAVNASAAAMLTQVPIIGEQSVAMQEDLIATSTEVAGLTTNTDGLNTISLGGLMGEFAKLRSSAEDQLGYINTQLALLQGGLAALSNFSINIPGISGQSGGGHMYGGVIPSGTVGRVHGNEIMAAAPIGTDISVLNAQTSSTIEGALAALVGNGGGGSSNTVYNNNQQFIYNVQSNAQGYMSDGAARAARGF